MSAAVYRAFDATNRLLYVGCSVEVPTRLRYHETNAMWWVFQTRIEVEDFDTHKEALEAEALAIATEHPRWNIVGRSEAHPDGACNTIQSAKWLDYEKDVARRLRRLAGEEARLLRELRKVRMGLAGARLEADAISNGYELRDEDVA